MTATEDHALYAHWELGTATPYIVKHWQQNISDDQYTEVTADQQNLTGTTNGKTNAQAKSYTGFTAQTFEQLTIAADGTTMVNIYYDRNTYTAKWDVDGTISTVDYRYGATITKPTDPNKEHYIFAGWSGYTDGMTMGDADITFAAQWTAVTYSVTLNAKGGTAAELTQYTYGIGATLPTATRTGYAFGGWYDNEDCTGSPVAAISTTDSGNKVFYARWTAHTYTVVFHANGGEGSMNSQSFTYDVAQNLTANTFTKSGYTFTGWNTQTNGDGTAYANGAEVSNLTSTNNGTINLYAQWSEQGYSIAYNLDGGTASGNPTSYSVGSADIALIAPTKTGYTFKGWTGSNGGTPELNVTIPAGSTGNREYTAHWTANSYTVSFDVNGGEGSMDGQSFTYDVAQNLTANAFTRSGYTFSGWNTQTDGNGISYTNAQQVSNLTAENNGAVTLYAQWSEAGYSISYELNGGAASNPASYSVNSADFTLNNPTRTGYTFTGWSGTGLDGENNSAVTITQGSTGDRSYTAHWTANRYTVSFDANGGDGSMTNQSFTYDVEQELKVNTFTRTGHEFAGWNTAADGSGTTYADKAEVINLASESGAEVTLYAKWTVKTYSISYLEADDIGGRTEYTYSATEDRTFKITTPEKDNHTFTGWTCSNDSITITADNGEYTVTIPAGTTGNITITANWKQNGIILCAPNGNPLDELSEGAALSYTVSYDNNGTTVTNKIVAYWLDNNTGTHYCNGTMASYLAEEGVLALQAVLMDTDHPMEINHNAQLTEIVNNSWLSGHYKLVSDVTLYSTWAGIGAGTSNTTAFTGTFDGNWHTITYGQIVEGYDPDPARHSLFNYANGATIMNLTVTGYLTSSDTYIGGIAGYAADSSIENCKVSGNACISTSRKSDNSDYCYLGGIVGYLDGTSTISGCEVMGTEATPIVIKAENLYKSHVGGIVGYINVNTGLMEDNPLKGSILNCSASYANITATTRTESGYSSGEANTGGLAGSVIANGSVSISGCTVSNAICTSVANKSGFYARTAGIAGYASAQWKSSGTAVLLIDQCTVDGSFTATGNDAYTFAAAVIGKLTLKENKPSSVTISSYNVSGASVTKNGSVSNYLIEDPATQAGNDPVTLVHANAT